MDYIQSLIQITERAREYNKLKIHPVFIDFRKCFRYSRYGCVMTALREQGVDGRILAILKKIYEQATAHIKLDRKGESFKIRRPTVTKFIQHSARMDIQEIGM